MSYCKYCNGIAGHHTRHCTAGYAEKVDRAANDPARIESRKSIPPALTVPRNQATETEVK